MKVENSSKEIQILLRKTQEMVDSNEKSQETKRRDKLDGLSKNSFPDSLENKNDQDSLKVRKKF